MITSLENINSDVSNEMYLRCKAQLEAFYNDSRELAIAYIDQAIEKNPNIQYARVVKFDICEKFNMLDEMKKILEFFCQNEYKVKYQNHIVCFKSVIMAMEGDVDDAVKYYLENIGDYTDEAKDKYILKLNRYSE